MHPLAFSAFVILALLALAWVTRFNVLRLRQARLAMETAVVRLGLTLVDARVCWAVAGPFASAVAMHQPVYRITVRDASGRTRRGWVKCRPFSMETEIAWEA